MKRTRALAKLWPLAVTVSDADRRAIRFLGWDVEPAIARRAGYGLGVATALLCILLAWLVLPVSPVVGLCVSLAVALGASHLAHAGPRLLATARRTRALGRGPVLVALAVQRMRIAPSPERAAAFAAETASGPLAASLASHVRAAGPTEQSGLERFAAEWAAWFPALGRALAQVTAAGRLTDPDRQRTLDRALEAVLDGTQRQMRSYAGSIRGPATALYAFGVLLPVALVSLLPAARAAGLPITLPVIVAVYDVLLPLGLLAAGAWLVSHRPVAFPPPSLGSTHPDVPDRRASAAMAGCLAGGIAALGVAALFPPWAPPIAALGAGMGTGLVVRYRPYDEVRTRIRAIETQLPDALDIVGRRVAQGAAVEAALESAAADLDGPLAEVLETDLQRQAALGVGIERGLLGEWGPLASIPSPRLRGSARLFAVAAREGRPAGEALVALADHLDALQRVERESRADLRAVLETLRSTGAYFGPLVGGATVALAGRLTAEPALPGDATAAIPGLGLAVGGYVLAMAAILTALSIGLERGLDRHLLGARIGLSLLAATASYLAGYVVAAAVA